LLLFATSLIFLLAIWFWGFVYTTSHVNHDDSNKGLSIKVSAQSYSTCIFNFVRLQELMLGRKHNTLLQKLGLNGGREINFQNEPIRFLRPTVANLYSLGRKGLHNFIVA